MKKYFPALLLWLMLAACSKMDSPYKDFIAGGKIKYAAKADSVTVFPGRERLQLKWYLLSDPKINKAVIYWNEKNDSHVVAIERKYMKDTITTVIEGVPEGTYTFDIYTFDNNNNSSIKVPILGSSYGNIYQSGLFARPVKSKMLASDTLRLQWYDASEEVVGVEARYTGFDGVARQFMIPLAAAEGRLPKVKAGVEVELRTAYLPDPHAIDTFYTPFVKLSF